MAKPPEFLRVAIVTERPILRRVFVRLLETLSRNIEIDVAADCCDVLLLDLGACECEAAESAIVDCVDQRPNTRVVGVVDEQDDEVVDTIMASGAVGVVVKSTPPSVLVESLTLLLDGEQCRPAPVREISRLDVPETVRAQLTAREQKMLRLISGGQSIGYVARELGLTRARVVTDMRRIMATVRGKH